MTPQMESSDTVTCPHCGAKEHFPELAEARKWLKRWCCFRCRGWAVLP